MTSNRVDDGAERKSGDLRQVGPYSFLRELARGGMGAVYEVVHEQTGVRYALKTLLPAQLGAAAVEELERFRREAEVMGRLNHPHVARIHAAQLEGATPYLVQELLTGGTLGGRIKSGPLDVAEAVEIAAKLAQGLQHSHEHGVLHRDLKPGNILFDERGEPRLVDFGLAYVVVTQRLTQTGSVMGTPGYMAPEQALGARDVDARTDVFGLGAVLYAMLTGRPPFQGGSVLATLDAVANRDPQPPSALRPEVDVELEAICLACLEKAPEKRYASAAELADDLRRYQNGEPTRARSRGSVPHALSRARRAGPLFFVLLLILPVGGVAWLARPSAEVPPPPAPSPTPSPEPTVEVAEVPEKPDQPAFAGFEWLREETFSCSGNRHTVQIYRCQRFAEALELDEDETDVACEFVLLPRDMYAMGSRVLEGKSSRAERPTREVTVESFLIARTEVTQHVWQEVMDTNPSRAGVGPRLPVNYVLWEDMQTFCERVGLRLPSEAEWEYACRTGVRGSFPFEGGEGAIGSYAWFHGNSAERTHRVAQKEPNAFGLFDMHGNVWEACQDAWHDDYVGAPSTGWPAWDGGPGATGRVCRGGSWNSKARRCRSAYRHWVLSAHRLDNFGFRPVFSP